MWSDHFMPMAQAASLTGMRLIHENVTDRNHYWYFMHFRFAWRFEEFSAVRAQGGKALPNTKESLVTAHGLHFRNLAWHFVQKALLNKSARLHLHTLVCWELYLRSWDTNQYFLGVAGLFLFSGCSTEASLHICTVLGLGYCS